MNFHGMMKVNVSTVDTKDLREWMAECALELRRRATLTTLDAKCHDDYFRERLKTVGYKDATMEYYRFASVPLVDAFKYIKRIQEKV